MISGIKPKIILFAFFLIAVSREAFAYDNGDFQIWNSNSQEKQISEKAKVTAEEEFRYADNANQLYYHHYDVGFFYAFNKNFDLSLNYRHIYERRKGKFRIENEPCVNAVFKWDMLGFSFSDRNRVEYRHFDYQTDFWRYRNTIAARFPWEFTRFKIRPYLSDELFIAFRGTAFNNNRFYSGAGFTAAKNIKGEFYYLLQHTRTVGKTTTNWPFINVFGAKFKLVF